MSALELNDRDDSPSLSYYAPRPRRAANDLSIRPVLARLRGSHDDHPLVDSGPLTPSDQPLGAADGDDARSRLLSMAARLAAVTALCAGTATIGYFMQAVPQEQAKPQRENRAALPPAAAPKPVQTVSFKSQARLGDATAAAAGVPVSSAETRGQPLRDSAAQVVDGPEAETTAAAPAPLASPGAMPAALSPAGWSQAAGEAEPAETTEAPVKEHEPKEHHAAHARHHYRHHHHYRHRHVAPAVQPPEPAVEASPPQPAQSSLTDVLHKIFKTE